MFRTDRSRALYERACQSLILGVSTAFRRKVTPVPLYMERANGPYYYDMDGQELLDYTLAWGPLILGNNHPTVNAAIALQLSRGYTYGAQHMGEIELAELMVKVLPGVERVLFSNTGSEAVQSALRLCRALTGRDKYVKFEGHYHGWMNNVLVSVHSPPQADGRPVPGTGGQPASEYAGVIALPWNDLAAVERAFAAHPGQIACVITEPVNVNSGSCMPEEGYLAGLLDLCRRHGAVSIFDEVITGFRVALGGAREYFGLQPDLSIYAKAMAAGFPMAAVGGRKEVLEVLVDGRTMHAGTYNGNPICTAAAIAAIQALCQPGLYERMHQHGYAIRRALEQAAAACGLTLATSGTGTCFSAHFGLARPPRNWSDVTRADAPTYDRFRAQMLARCVQLLPEGRWYVGASHTDAELQRVLPAIEQSMQAIA
ncbi:MAG: aminotransferase class III-fold pyridoxal phosphate-dependent enzyme [Candidatus Latescibacterota bacterium]